MEETLKDHPVVVRCHRAFLVNLQQVEKINSQSGTMRLIIKHTHDTLPVSRTHSSQLKSAFNSL
jgi:DNA-binding LytR/AlgR family response regulator